MERRKLFGDQSIVERRSLFSSVPRRKLFCNTPKVMICQDCGHEIETTDITTSQICPNCGGNRFNVKGSMSTRRSLFDKNRVQPGSTQSGQDSTESEKKDKCSCGGHCESVGTPDATGELLKEFSGKSVDKDTLQKLFTERGISGNIDSLINSGYASLNEEGQVCFSEDADFTYKLFSELVISVTKELHLVPAENRVEELIEDLENRGNLGQRGIVLVKKAHGIIPREQVVKSFSETTDYLEDSGLANDLKLEWGGKKMSLKEFMDILNTQYNDAPDDILDVLVDSGVIRISGSQVEVI